MDYYATLGIKHGATKDEIKKAFHRLAHVHHPDKGGDIEKFKKINNAYQELMKQPQGHTVNVNPNQTTYNNNSSYQYGSSWGTRFYYQQDQQRQQQSADMREYMRMMNEMFSKGQAQAPNKKWKYDPKRGLIYE